MRNWAAYWTAEVGEWLIPESDKHNLELIYSAARGLTATLGMTVIENRPLQFASLASLRSDALADFMAASRALSPAGIICANRMQAAYSDFLRELGEDYGDDRLFGHMMLIDCITAEGAYLKAHGLYDHRSSLSQGFLKYYLSVVNQYKDHNPVAISRVIRDGHKAFYSAIQV